MTNDTSREHEAAIDALLIALAMQAGEMNNGRVSERVLDSLVDENRLATREPSRKPVVLSH